MNNIRYQPNFSRAVFLGCVSSLFVEVFSFSPFSKMFYGNLIQVPVLYVGLRWGIIEALTSSLLTSFLLFSSGVISKLELISFSLLSILPSLVLIYYTLKLDKNGEVIFWYPTGLVIAKLLFYSIAITFLLSYIFLKFDGQLIMSSGFLSEPGNTSVITKFSNTVIPVIAGCSVLLKTSLCAFLTQVVLSRQGRSVRPLIKITEISLPWWPWYGLLMLSSVRIFSSKYWLSSVCFDILCVILIVFFFEGLSVIHTVFKESRVRTFSLTVFYLLIFLTGIPFIIAVIIGIFEPLIRLYNHKS